MGIANTEDPTGGHVPKKTFTEQERAAIQERAREAQAEERRGPRADIEDEVLAKIAEMKDPDRAMAKRLHAIIKTNVPELAPKLWYGMPAYAKNGKIICFFQAAAKFKTRYAELGFNDPAKLDDGAMWPVAYALTKLSPVEEARIVALVNKAVG
jgi:uncharacterized protein YdhG (YjbR/CyaY superfamily)